MHPSLVCWASAGMVASFPNVGCKICQRVNLWSGHKKPRAPLVIVTKHKFTKIDRFIMAPACCWCLALTFVLQEFKFIIVEMAGLPSGGIMFLAHALAGTHWLLCIMFAGFGIYIFVSHPPTSFSWRCSCPTHPHPL